jgi:hypothetical protein
MQAALRPYATAGVALVGASVIAVSPVAVPPTAVQEIQDRAVELYALENPFLALRQVLEATANSARLVGQGIIDNPAPIVQQLIGNQFENLAGLPAGIQHQIDALPQLPGSIGDGLQNELGNIGTLSGLGLAALQNVIGAITGTGPGTVLDQLQRAIAALDQDGDFEAAFNLLALIPLAIVAGGNGLPNLFELPAELGAALAQPFDDLARILPIAAGPLGNAGNVAAALPLATIGIVAGPLLNLASLPGTLGKTINGLVEAGRTNNPELAVKTIVDQSSLALGTLLNTVVGQGGLIDGIQSFREAIATALGAPPALASLASVTALPSATSKSITLAAPLEKVPAKAGGSTIEESTGSAADTSTAASGTDKQESIRTTTLTISTHAKDSAKGGNLFTPGSTSTKGGRHRADTGSFAQGVRDTIKGLTGLGRGKNSESSSTTSKSGESASSSSSSASSGSGGGTGSK